ncbi:vacuolar ATPase assembly integral membrane protein vma21 [Alternaria novae-zelandiae]|uniref:vacuolar ATPase assembly integral membrane protein vma21 n=1 Tax=Alternaria novae-zelandiae TaxID=430562 RepID=UPI0020C35128|nr:vacuolar ATPase assembly integral membrane protein vma21 [Alternaria novae-zelandiae]KAI4684863.1 vacuolar ATPase assembly integral membrane protein vma21 [Alternaria novae-zelandiae]
MTTRRTVNEQKSSLDYDGKPAPEPSNTSPAVPSSVIWKLMSFTFAMITLPIGTYFFSVNFVFKGNATWAGGLAALMANVVLIAYVIMAFKDDQEEMREEAEKSKKNL